jgi:hypothetical protein
MGNICNLIATTGTEDQLQAGRLLVIILGIGIALFCICRSAVVYEQVGSNKKSAKALILVGFAMLLSHSVSAYSFMCGVNLSRFAAVAFIALD